MLARGLAGVRSGTIGILGPDLSDPFFPELADELQRAARAAGLQTFLASTFRDPDQQAQLLGSLRSYGVDGVIIHPVPNTRTQLETVAASGVSVVVLERDWVAPNLTSVASDLEGGAQAATEHLTAKGRRRVGMIDGDIDTDGRRRAGYLAALGSPSESLIHRTTPDRTGGFAAMRRLLDVEPNLDGVICYNDLIALGAVSAVVEAGHRVPDDVAVVGFDDIRMAEVASPALTTVRYEYPDVAAAALTALQDLLNRSSPVQQPLLVATRLVERQTS